MPENKYFPAVLLDAGVSGVAKRFGNNVNSISELKPNELMTNINFFLKDEKAVEPFKASEGAAGFDLSAHSLDFSEDGLVVKIGTGVHFSIPHGMFGMLVPRSSIYKKNLLLANNVGIIDSDYRGEIIMVYRSADGKKLDVGHITTLLGERVGQILFLNLHYPIAVTPVSSIDELGSTQRGEGGFGSTGLK